jgi:hypothetical protein
MTAVARPNGQGRLDFGATERAAQAVAANPSMSNRAIARQIRVDEGTVRKARKATADPSAVRTIPQPPAAALRSSTGRCAGRIVAAGRHWPPMQPSGFRHYRRQN